MMRLCYRFALGLIVIAGVACMPHEDTKILSTERPNILLIVAEDMGSRLGAFDDSVASTPVLDALAQESIRYPNMFTAAPVCAPSRSALITGVSQLTLGTQHMRTKAAAEAGGGRFNYFSVPPPEVKAFPELLRAAGYYTANTAKTDYQFGEPFTIWDRDIDDGEEKPWIGELAPWRARPKGKPFFVMVNLLVTHESFIWPMDREPTTRIERMVVERNKAFLIDQPRVTDPEDIAIPPYYPDTPIIRQDLARHYDNIHIMDSQVGEILANLESDDLAANTIVIFMTDHGDGLPRAKKELYDSGIRVPLIVRLPEVPGVAEVRKELISGIDLAPTILSLAGVPIPGFMQGRVFVGPGYSAEPEFIFAAKDRMDELSYRARAVRDHRFKLIRNYKPDRPVYYPSAFRDKMPLMQELWKLHSESKLNETQEMYFHAPPMEEFYDLSGDPYEINNVALDPAYQGDLIRLRGALDEWLIRADVFGETNELEMALQMWPGGIQPETERPSVILVNNKQDVVTVTMSTESKGASIGYRIVDNEDEGLWQLYIEPLHLVGCVVIEAKAVRYGYKESTVALNSNCND